MLSQNVLGNGKAILRPLHATRGPLPEPRPEAIVQPGPKAS